MKKIIEIWPAFCFRLLWRAAASCVLFLLFLNHCEAQNPKALVLESPVKNKLSGIYSSKNPAEFSEGKNEFSDLLPSDFPITDHEYKELIDKRTYKTRTFADSKGGVVIQNGSKNLNYLNNENKFEPIYPWLHTSSTGWEARQQQFPTHLYKDGSTAISPDEKNKIVFNKDCKINDKELNLSDFTVGEEGMFIKNAIQGIDKKIIFNENTIETDYVISQPLNTGNQDLTISEQIELPEGYYIAKTSGKETEQLLNNLTSHTLTNGDEDYVVYSADNKVKARFRAPVFYDGKKEIVFGKYSLTQQNSKVLLQITIPGNWLNDVSRTYPITIDPVVTGPMTNFPAIYMNSCPFPSFETDSILVTIPANITITKFIVEDSYFADLFATPPAALQNGIMSLTTVCGTVNFSCNDTNSTLPGTCYLIPNQDLKTNLACCFSPSCSDQTFYLKHGLARTNLGPNCNQTYIYYSPVSLLPPYPTTTFSAFIVGNTVESTQAEWSVFPSTICSDICTVSLKITTNYGVPPYTITHPWATGSDQYGTSVGACNSTGSDTITLNIPGCPTTCGTSTGLSVPPPVIVDVCGNVVTGLSPKSITINPVPVATATSVSICTGNPVNIPVTSCVPGSTFAWTGSNGSNGTGDINDTELNPGQGVVTINYAVIPSAHGCVGQAINISADINPLPIIIGEPHDTTIESGESIQLNAFGGVSYVWSPSDGLSCTNCASPSGLPFITNFYYVNGINQYGCSSSDTVNIIVTQKNEVLYIPNSFTPNHDRLDDLFYTYGTGIKKIDIQIYDRWGEMLFRTSDMTQGWDGKFRGKEVELGVYAYSVHCEFFSGKKIYRNGIVNVVK